MSHSQCHFGNLCQFGFFVLHIPINWIVSFSGHIEQDFMFIRVNFLFPSFPHFESECICIYCVCVLAIWNSAEFCSAWKPFPVEHIYYSTGYQILFYNLFLSVLFVQKNVQKNLIHSLSRPVIPECIIWKELGAILLVLGHFTSLSHQWYILIH